MNSPAKPKKTKKPKYPPKMYFLAEEVTKDIYASPLDIQRGGQLADGDVLAVYEFVGLRKVILTMEETL